MSFASSQTHHLAHHRATVALPAVLAVVFGLFLVWGTGFASPAVLHDAAHDARHAMSFPCH
ncbi:MAG: CbtB domain-containing protein [Rhodospirillales bacterium]|nr:CbtB domain-containing protein [Rhodospirillales bacterium]MDP6773164.1 CbtB domain-containing protein [Rhodospirillales bacterium]